MDIIKLLNPIPETASHPPSTIRVHAEQGSVGNLSRSHHPTSTLSDLNQGNDPAIYHDEVNLTLNSNSGHHHSQPRRYRRHAESTHIRRNSRSHSPIPSPVFSASPSPSGSGSERTSPSSSPAPRPPHSNLPYRPEEMDFLRYLKEDRGFGWPEITTAFNAWAPPGRKRSLLGLHSRYYRDQSVPVPQDVLAQLSPADQSALASGTAGDLEVQFLEDRMVIRAQNGDVAIRHRIRDRDTDEGREIRERFGVAYKLVDRAPEKLLAYDWNIIREEDRQAARERLGIKVEEEADEEQVQVEEKGKSKL